MLSRDVKQAYFYGSFIESLMIDFLPGSMRLLLVDWCSFTLLTNETVVLCFFKIFLKKHLNMIGIVVNDAPDFGKPECAVDAKQGTRRNFEKLFYFIGFQPSFLFGFVQQ